MTSGKLIRRLLSSDQGQDLIEYALLAGFIALVCVVAIQNFTASIGNVFTQQATEIQTTGS